MKTEIKIWTPEEVKSLTPKRFWSKIKFGEPDECWEWQGTKFIQGYALFYVNDIKKTFLCRKAHRYLFMCLCGAMPANIFVCHSCDNRCCCNPNHLFAGTNQDNMADKIKKGRQLKGSKTRWAKLAEVDIPEVRRRIANGEYHKDIGKSYGLTSQSISSIKIGRSWKHVL